uniref:Solute carrier organic anion transporter family member n=1 Tax=Clastoptera arizonana TaxID=38151 RepID=A0A1B6C2D4_9HEMI
MNSSCGLGKWRPTWLQRLNTTRGFMLVYGLLGTIQAMSYIYFVATLTTIEKRFKIPSRTTGLVMSGNEISQIMLSLFLSYFGGQRNRPVWIAWGVAFSALSCFILALPHFLYGPGSTALSLTKEYVGSTVSDSTKFRQKDEALCSANNITDCSHSDTGGEFSNVPPLLIFFSQFVLGIGTTLYYSLGQTYIDDNAKKTKTPLLLGMTLSLRTIGPAFGFMLGFACLSFYISPTLTPIIDNKDPRWLGAWWLGWLLLGSIMLLFSLFIAMFPKKLPPSKTKVDVEVNSNVKENGSNKDKDAISKTISENSVHRNTASLEKFQLVEDNERIPSLKEFPAALKRLLKNKLLISNILSSVFYILGGSAYITYLAKYMEVQFHQTAAGASFVIGPAAIIAMTTGFLLSGVLISKFKFKPKYLLPWNVVVGFVFVFGEISFIYLSCEDSALMGYDKANNHFDLINDCNRGCHCNIAKYNPVCWEEEQLNFYTACHAGCYQSELKDKLVVYSNCTCLPDISNSGIDNLVKQNVILKTGNCQSDCYRTFITFMLITMFMHFLGSSGRIGNVLVNYRAVDAIDKSFAQGLSLLMISLFAFIPGPILYGAIIDSTCISWDDTCGQRGNCWLYNKEDFRLYINVISASLTFIGTLFDVLVCYYGRNLDLYGEDEIKETKEAVVDSKPSIDKY